MEKRGLEPTPEESGRTLGVMRRCSTSRHPHHPPWHGPYNGGGVGAAHPASWEAAGGDVTLARRDAEVCGTGWGWVELDGVELGLDQKVVVTGV